MSHSPRQDDGARVSVVDCFCPRCKLLESCQRGSPGYADLYRRWHGSAPIETNSR